MPIHGNLGGFIKPGFNPLGPQTEEYTYELYAWGGNAYGELGLGNTTYYSSPVQVGALTTWTKVSAGNQFSVAIKNDGTMWSWGYNGQGQLGLGDTTERSSPVQIGALTTWASVSVGGNFALAIKTDGTLWSWGSNTTYGQLGLGDTTNRSSPVQVGALTTWAKVSMGFGNYSIAVKTDGTLWGWGKNNFAQLGLNNTTDYSSPVQVGALTNWSKIAAGNENVLAIKTDGTLWTWGYNNKGQLGLGDTTDRSSPVQVGALTTWRKLPYRMLGNKTSFAITKS